MESVESGAKTIAVRVGYCSVEPGPLEIRSASGFWSTTKVDVVSVQRKAISDLSDEELNQSGVSTVDAMVRLFLPAHPCLSTNSDVTVIGWKAA
ncbi:MULTISPECIES: hypothetical protein [unclassified Rhizobium]|uniref:hypothetical protein n=1 Tax=unclassified Rhizobium TaxID=2613769 RepID=UPI00179F86CC|nr:MULTISPECIES: hypothetical protein [unclassified Rhizobium]MBB3319814.1 hypothetical protein [Rhizobium sp. BK181]MBB3545495.1 hypothetical protein [Rhizobium sp. BK399]MCS4096754.1 hypothetical protein [Rhizobium sp. BK176]